MKVAAGGSRFEDSAGGEPARLVDEVDAILWTADPDTLRFLYVSKGAERILGYPVSRWLESPDFWVSIIHPEDRDRAVAFCREQIGECSDHEFRYRAVGAGGQIVWLRDNVRVEVDPAGKAAKLHGVMFDITDRQARLAQQVAGIDLGNLALSAPLPRLLDEVARVIAETLDVDLVEISEIDYELDRVVRVAAVGDIGPPEDLEQEPTSPGSWTAAVLGASAPVVAGQVSDAPGLQDDDRLRRRGITSAMGAAVSGPHGRSFGLIGVYSRSSRRFSTDEVHFLNVVSTIVASAATRAEVEAELRRRESQLETAQEIASLGSWEWVSATGRVWWSKELFAVHGQDPDRFAPSYDSFLAIIVDEDRDAIRERIQTSFATRADLEFDYRFVRSDGTRRRGHALARWVGNGDAADRLIGTVQDVTESKEADLRVRESEQRLRAIFDNAGLGMVTVTPLGRIREANRMLHDMLDHPPGGLRGKHFEDVTHPDDVASDRASFAELMDGARDGYTMEKRFLRADGGEVWGLLTATAVRNDDGDPTMAVGMVQDITIRKRALGELVESRAELSEKSDELARLTRRLVELQEAERRNIAHDLHDEVGQILTGLKLTLEAAPDSESAGTVVGRALPLVEDLISLVRDMTLTLRPPMLDDLGLLPALAWHVARYEHATDVRVDLRHEGLERRFDQNVETAAYRVVQEALTNVARHAGSTDVMVEVAVRNDRLRVEVADSGVGFDPRHLDPSTHGLLGMRERMVSLGGRFSIYSAPGVGTTVMAEVPVGAPG